MADRKDWGRLRARLGIAGALTALGIGAAAFAPGFAAAHRLGLMGWGPGNPAQMRQRAERMTERNAGPDRCERRAARARGRDLDGLIDALIPLAEGQREQRAAWRAEFGRGQIDRAALEGLRAETLAQLDQASVKLVAARAEPAG